MRIPTRSWMGLASLFFMAVILSDLHVGSADQARTEQSHPPKVSSPKEKAPQRPQKAPAPIVKAKLHVPTESMTTGHGKDHPPRHPSVEKKPLRQPFSPPKGPAMPHLSKVRHMAVPKHVKSLQPSSNQLKAPIRKTQHPKQKGLVGQLLLALGSTLLLGMLLVLGWSRRGDRVYRKQELERLIQLPVIQEIHWDKDLQPIRKKAKRDFPDTLGAGEPSVPLLIERPDSTIKAELEALKSRLSTLTLMGQKVFTILSPEAESGTTFLISNLALLFSTSGQKTVVMDGNLRHPELHHVFGLANSPGLTDLLEGRVNIKQVLHHHSQYGPLFVMTSGLTDHDPLHYLEHAKMPTLIDSLKKHFDVILLNAPSERHGMDGPMLANLSQKVLLNIRQKDATSSCLRVWQKQLAFVTQEKLGLVINFKTS